LSVAKDEIRRCAGTQFDPDLANLFSSISDDAWMDIRTHVESLEADEVRKWASKTLEGPGRKVAPALATESA
jgi:hypothetical protein